MKLEVVGNMNLVVRYSKKEDISNIVKKNSTICAQQINNYYKEIKQDDPIIVLTGGDKGQWKKNEVRPDPGIYAFGKIKYISKELDGDKNYEIKIEIDKWFDKAIESSFFIGYPQTYNSFSIAPLTKNTPNQALVKIEDDKLRAILKALLVRNKINEDDIVRTFGEIVLKDVLNFKLLHLVPDSSINANDIHTNNKKGENLLIYGAPGTGKSFIVNENTNPKEYERVTFYPDYEYTDFVGGLKPVRNLNEKLDYKFVPGPFTDTIINAINNPLKKIGIIIEELNRANSAAVFGDCFQLLDRDKNGISRYSIKNKGLSKYIDRKTNKKMNFESEGIRIPGNMDIIATMNPSDQGVFPLDAAFKRRWIQYYKKIDWNESLLVDENLAGFDKKWDEVGSTINEFLLDPENDIDIEEDELLGQYFITKDEYQDKQKVGSKLLGYLWNDVARYSRKKLFNNNLRTLSQVLDNYEYGKPIFVSKLQDQLDG